MNIGLVHPVVEARTPPKLTVTSTLTGEMVLFLPYGGGTMLACDGLAISAQLRRKATNSG